MSKGPVNGTYLALSVRWFRTHTQCSAMRFFYPNGSSTTGGGAAYAGLRTWALVAALLLPLPCGKALEAQEGPVTFEFSFSNPGARSMGLGGAFAGLADDATAAFANPAGLVQLLEPELSIEGRSWSYDTPFVEGGRISGSPTALGVDTGSGLSRGSSSNQSAGLSFAAFVYPMKRWSVALYHHTWADFELTSSVNGLFAVVDGELDRSEDVRAQTQVEVVNTGFSAAYQVTETFSLGLGIVHYNARMDSVSSEYAHDEDAFFERNTFAPELLDTTYSHQADSSGVNVHAGFLWKVSPLWSVGGYLRQGPRMTLRVVEVVGPTDDEVPEGTIELDATSPLNLPDVYGLGVAYRAAEGDWTLSAEWTRVTYSSITDDLNPQVFDPGEIHIDDGNELRLGAEYVFLRSTPVIAVRAGSWLDPAHSVTAAGTADTFERAIFQEGDDELHLTAGVGVVLDRFQVDGGVDYSDRAVLASISLVYRF